MIKLFASNNYSSEKLKKIYRNIKIPGSHQDKTHNVWHQNQTYQAYNEAELMTHNEEKNQSMKTDPEKKQMLD